MLTAGKGGKLCALWLVCRTQHPSVAAPRPPTGVDQPGAALSFFKGRGRGDGHRGDSDVVAGEPVTVGRGEKRRRGEERGGAKKKEGWCERKGRRGGQLYTRIQKRETGESRKKHEKKEKAKEDSKREKGDKKMKQTKRHPTSKRGE